MAKKNIRVSRRMLFTWFMLAGLILFFSPQTITNRFQLAFAHVFRLPLSIGRSISLSARSSSPSNARPADINVPYQNYIADLQAQLRQERLKVEKLSGIRQRLPLQHARLMLADVITLSIDALRAEIMINRGREDGLVTGQIVLAENSIVGTVEDISARTALVRLFTDPQATMPVQIQDFGEKRLLVNGDGNSAAKIRMLKKKVRIGTPVFAHKKPGFLDTPIIVGTVTACRRNPEPLLWDLTVQPACDIQKIHDVVVIVMDPPG